MQGPGPSVKMSYSKCCIGPGPIPGEAVVRGVLTRRGLCRFGPGPEPTGRFLLGVTAAGRVNRSGADVKASPLVSKVCTRPKSRKGFCAYG